MHYVNMSTKVLHTCVMVFLKPKINSIVPDGFTIIETMFVLAISMTIGITALIMLSRDIGEDNFSTAANNFSQKIQEDMVDATSGYYNYSKLTCTPNPLGGSITVSAPTTSTQGTNFGCVSLGAAIQFFPYQNNDPEPNRYVIVPVDGSQYYNGNVALTVDDSGPVPLEPPYTGTGDGGIGDSAPDLSQTENLEQSLTIDSVKACDASDASCTPSTYVNTGVIAFLDGDGGSLASGSGETLNSGSLPTTLYYVKDTYIGEPQTSAAQEINAGNLAPAKSVQICITDGQKSYSVTITGTNTSQVASQIFTGDDACS